MVATEECQTEEPWARRRPAALALAVISVGYLMVIVDSTAVNVALPVIGRAAHGDVTWLQWVVDGYSLVRARPEFITGLHAGLVVAAGAFLSGAVITGFSRPADQPGRACS
jgi:MFS family permease